VDVGQAGVGLGGLGGFGVGQTQIGQMFVVVLITGHLGVFASSVAALAATSKYSGVKWHPGAHLMRGQGLMLETVDVLAQGSDAAVSRSSRTAAAVGSGAVSRPQITVTSGTPMVCSSCRLPQVTVAVTVGISMVLGCVGTGAGGISMGT
jgi:hypothetical protein